jgi:hypothetical protein
MAGPSGYNPKHFGPITDRPVHHAGPSGYVADRPPSYTGPSGYGMNRPTYYAGPSDSTRVHAADYPNRAIYGRSVRVQPWTIRPDRGPSSSLRQTVWVRDYPRSTIYGWTIRIYLQTIWPGRGPFGLLRRTVRICIRTVPIFIAATSYATM